MGISVVSSGSFFWLGMLHISLKVLEISSQYL